MTKSSLLLTLILFTGCSTSTNHFQTAEKPVENEYGRVVVYRPSSLFGIGYKPPIYIGSTIVGYSVAGTRFNVDVPEGEHTFSISTTSYSTTAALLGGGVAALAVGPRHSKTDPIKFSIKKGEKVCIKSEVVMGVDGSFEFDVVDCDQNEKSMAETELIAYKNFKDKL
ncbi:MAG: hypothetical protein PHF52_08585 [Sulfurospirillaceae bacterium]|nr:hypothetical protein [Sulfurospirillaceae bacterium]